MKKVILLATFFISTLAFAQVAPDPMAEQVVNIAAMFISLLMAVPVVGKFLAVLVGFAVPMIGVINALVAIWQAIVIFAKALSFFIPSMNNAVEGMKVVEDKIVGIEKSYIIPLLNRLSVIPLPKAKGQLSILKKQ